MRSRILISLLAGTAGGLIGGVLQETFIHYQAVQNVITGACVSVPLTNAEVCTLALCVGGMIGMLLGAVDGIMEGSPRKLGRGILFGLFAGMVLGYTGLELGGVVYNWLGGSNDAAVHATPGAFIHQVIARTFGMALLGLGVGAGASLGTLSSKRIWHGIIGGFAGGFIGGFIFDLLSTGATPVQGALGSAGCHDAGGASRMIGFTLIGALIGFFIGLVDELLKEAWVRVLAGRNEGKDYILSKPVNILGRDERSDVPLYGDTSVGIQHAAIRGDGHRHTLIDAGTPVGTVVNGQRLPAGGELLLRDGDMIQIGALRILFREKATAKKVGQSAVDTPRAKPAGPANTPMPAHLCPFCGAPKDAAGNCLCTVGAGVAAPSAGAGYYDPNAGVNPLLNSSGTAPSAYGGSVLAVAPAGRLIGLEGAAVGQVLPLSGQNMTLGREPGKDIVLTGDSTVSRTHARIANENGTFVVYDNNSANGTYVNGQRITIQTLAPGDIVQFGSSKFRFE